MKKQDLLEWSIRLLIIALGFVLASNSFIMAQHKLSTNDLNELRWG